MSTFDDQGKFFLPWNPITAELKHDTRIIISMFQKVPYVYKITKVKNTSQKGMITFTIKQDRFEPAHDYVSLDPNADDYGDMYADYYASDISAHDDVYEKEEVNDNNGYRIEIEAANYNVKLGTSKVLSARIYDANDKDVTEEFYNSEYIWTLNGVPDELIVFDNDYSLKDGNRFKCKFKFDGDESYIDNNIEVTCTIGNMTAKVALDIIAL